MHSVGEGFRLPGTFSEERIKIIGGHLLYVPGKNGAPAQCFHIKKFDFEGSQRRGSELSEEEVLGILHMSKAVLEQMTQTHASKAKSLTELRISFDTHKGSAKVTQVAGAAKTSTDVSSRALTHTFKKVTPLFEQSQCASHLDLDNLDVDEGFRPLEGGLHLTEEARKAAQDNKPIVCQYFTGGVDYGTETIDEMIRPGIYEEGDVKLSEDQQQGISALEHAQKVAEATLVRLKKSKKEAQKKLDHYLQKGSSRSVEKWKTRLQSIKGDIRYYRRKIDQIDAYINSNGKTWLDSEYWRSSIREVNDYDAAAKAYIAAPINMRYHSYTSPDGDTSGMMRIGVISDMRNGWYSLHDLQQFREAYKRNPADAFDLMAKRLKVIAKDFAKHFDTRENRDIAADFAKLSKGQDPLEMARYFQSKVEEQLEEVVAELREKTDETELSKVDDKIALQSFRMGLRRLVAILENPQVVQQVIEERRRVLGDQMVQLVAAQMLRTSPVVDDSGRPVFKMAHVGFLNTHKHEMENGWMHDEDVEISDMAAIFKEFDGMSIRFDDALGPSVDYEKGIVYLPTPTLPDGVSVDRDITLQTYFANICVQGNNKHDKAQKRINRAELRRLLKDHPKTALHASVKEIIKQLDARDPELAPQDDVEQISGFRAAEDLLVALINQGNIAVSGGCLSVKDRTGVVCARVMQRALESENGLTPERNPFADHILNPGMPASRVVFKNTGIWSLKVNPWQLRHGSGLAKVKLVDATIGTALDWVRARKPSWLDSTPNQKAWLKKQRVVRYEAARKAQDSRLPEFR